VDEHSRKGAHKTAIAADPRDKPEDDVPPLHVSAPIARDHFLNKVNAGIAAADRSEFATSADIERVLNKYRG
jgi:hypothetical protein